MRGKLKEGNLERLHICNEINSYGHDPQSGARKINVKSQNETIETQSVPSVDLRGGVDAWSFFGLKLSVDVCRLAVAYERGPGVRLPRA